MMEMFQLDYVIRKVSYNEPRSNSLLHTMLMTGVSSTATSDKYLYRPRSRLLIPKDKKKYPASNYSPYVPVGSTYLPARQKIHHLV